MLGLKGIPASSKGYSGTFRGLDTYYGSRKMFLKFQNISSLAFSDAKMLWLLQYLAEILSNVFVCHEWLYWGRKTCLESPQYSASRSVWGFFLGSLLISLLTLLPFYLLQISSEIVTLSRGWKDVFWALKEKEIACQAITWSFFRRYPVCPHACQDHLNVVAPTVANSPRL